MPTAHAQGLGGRVSVGFGMRRRRGQRRNRGGRGARRIRPRCRCRRRGRRGNAPGPLTARASAVCGHGLRLSLQGKGAQGPGGRGPDASGWRLRRLQWRDPRAWRSGGARSPAAWVARCSCANCPQPSAWCASASSGPWRSLRGWHGFTAATGPWGWEEGLGGGTGPRGGWGMGRGRPWRTPSACKISLPSPSGAYLTSSIKHQQTTVWPMQEKPRKGKGRRPKTNRGRGPEVPHTPKVPPRPLGGGQREGGEGGRWGAGWVRWVRWVRGPRKASRRAWASSSTASSTRRKRLRSIRTSGRHLRWRLPAR